MAPYRSCPAKAVAIKLIALKFMKSAPDAFIAQLAVGISVRWVGCRKVIEYCWPLTVVWQLRKKTQFLFHRAQFQEDAFPDSHALDHLLIACGHACIPQYKDSNQNSSVAFPVP